MIHHKMYIFSEIISLAILAVYNSVADRVLINAKQMYYYFKHYNIIKVSQ